MTQEFALSILQSGQNVFLTGPAGTGKTYVLNQYINYLRDRKIQVAITATTGIAATHMNGSTIHSWSGIGIKNQMSEADYKSLKGKQQFVKRLKNTSVLIIDEISMLHQRQFLLLDEVLRYFRDPFLPFGGLQMVLCGDFFQLPPVDRENRASKDIFAFMSSAWVNADFKICYLTKQYRQSENELQRILKGIRQQQLSNEDYDLLLSRRIESGKNSDQVFPHLYTHNMNVDRFNEQKLSEIEGRVRRFDAKFKGNNAIIDQLKRNVNAPENLRLKIGAQVMFVRNNAEEGYVNGTLGKVIDYNIDKFPIVRTRDGDEIVATPVSWSIENEKGSVLAEMEQVPLRLAWAITVHKSQGMTLDEACVDLSKAFEVGQGYVALSRLRELNHLSLLGFNDTALHLDPLAIKADRRFQELSQVVQEESDSNKLKEMASQFIQDNDGIVNKRSIKKNKDKRQRKTTKKTSHEMTKELVEEGFLMSEIINKRGLTMQTIFNHFYKIKEEDPAFDFSFLDIDDQIIDEVKKAIELLGEQSNSLTAIFELLGERFSYEQIKAAQLQL